MKKHLTRLLNQIDKFNLPSNQYAIFGSGPLAIRGLRQAHDIDILVTPKLLEKLKKQYPVKIVNDDEIVEINDIEAMISYPQTSPEKVQQMIKDAEEIKGYPFVKLEYLLITKKKLDRPKDHRDVKLIKKYLQEK